MVRENVRNLEAYFESMASSDTVSTSVTVQEVQVGVIKFLVGRRKRATNGRRIPDGVWLPVGRVLPVGLLLR